MHWRLMLLLCILAPCLRGHPQDPWDGVAVVVPHVGFSIPHHPGASLSPGAARTSSGATWTLCS